MSLLSTPASDTVFTRSIKSLITGLVVIGMENDPQYEENLACIATRLNGQLRLALILQYLITIFVADLIYIFYPRLGSFIWSFIRFVWEIIQIIADPSHPTATDSHPWNWQLEIVVVSGGSSGIGALIANQLAEHGIMVVLLDVKPPEQTTILRLKNVSFYQNRRDALVEEHRQSRMDDPPRSRLSNGPDQQYRRYRLQQTHPR
jgi:hypothetical protein